MKKSLMPTAQSLKSTLKLCGNCHRKLPFDENWMLAIEREERRSVCPECYKKLWGKSNTLFISI